MCHTCSIKGLGAPVLVKNGEMAFSVEGFNNWKKGVSHFEDHMRTEGEGHRAASEWMNATKQQPY